MNTELGLFSVTRRHKPGYRKGAAHKVFDNLLKRQFTVEYPDKFWCNFSSMSIFAVCFGRFQAKNLTKISGCVIINTDRAADGGLLIRFKLV